jgi:predicted histone-like DNA-binding protein
MAKIQVKTRKTRIAILDADKYVTSAVRYSTLSQDDLINLAAENSGISKANMAAAFYAITQQIEQFVCNGHGLELGRLGTFYISTKAKAADTAEDAGIGALVSVAVKFRQSKNLRDLMSRITFINGGASTMAPAAPDDDGDDDDDDPEVIVDSSDVPVTGGDGSGDNTSGEGEGDNATPAGN